MPRKKPTPQSIEVRGVSEESRPDAPMDIEAFLQAGEQRDASTITDVPTPLNHPEDVHEGGKEQKSPEPHVIEGEISPPLPSDRVRYESRIQIIDAWQYPGNVANAPAWVDRNWIGFGDDDPLRGIEAGPCLRVPSASDPNEIVLCRIGDYVAQQSVTLSPDASPIIRVEVWSRDQFQKLFLPVRASAPAPGGADPFIPTSQLPFSVRSTQPTIREMPAFVPDVDESSSR